MGPRSRHAALVVASVGLLAAVVSCADKAAEEAVEAAIEDAAIGRWDCTSSDADGSYSSKVTVGENSFKAVLPMGYSSAGTWRRDGDTVTITQDEGRPYHLLGIPVEARESATFKLRQGDADPTDASATYDGTTLRFSFADVKVHCVRA